MLSSASKECSGPTEEEELGAEVWAVEGGSWHCSFVDKYLAEGVLRLAWVWQFSSAERC